MYAIGIEAPEDDWALLVNIEEQRGREHDSQSVRVYKDGHAHFHMRSMHDYNGTPMVFEEWLRERVTDLVHDTVRGHIDGVFYRMKEAKPKKHRQMLVTMCREIAAMTTLPKPRHFGAQPICDALSALLHAHERGTMNEQEAVTIRGFLDAYDKPPMHKNLRDETVKYAFELLPEIVPAPVKDYLEREAKEQLGKISSDGDMTLQHLANFARTIVFQPAHIRFVYHDLVMPNCNTASACFIVATGLAAIPEEAVEYAGKGLGISPDHHGLRSISQHLIASKGYKKSHVRSSFDAKAFAALVGSWSQSPNMEGAKATLSNAVKWLEKYQALMPKVLYDRRNPDLGGKDQELIRLEGQINSFWLSMLPPREDPTWEEIAESLCLLNCFRAQGSEAYVAWLRFHHRFQEAIDYFLMFRENEPLLQLRSRSAWHFESYLAQALCCLLDSQRPEHLETALSLIDELEALITWKRSSVPYNLACITARSGQISRALTYAAQAVAAGSKLESMLKDSDFANILADPEAAAAFRALGDQEGV